LKIRSGDGLIAAVDQQTIGTNAIVAMAQNSNMLVAQLVGNGAMAYQVIITQSVIFMKV
jgi:hypothetical protein